METPGNGLEQDLFTAEKAVWFMANRYVGYNDTKSCIKTTKQDEYRKGEFK
jgi:hypothetical protein